jgi:hypothetical protein
VSGITNVAGGVAGRSNDAQALNFLPRNECVAQQHGFRPFAEAAPLFRFMELGYVT